MRIAVLLLALGAAGAPAPTPRPTPRPTPASSPTAKAVLSRGAPAAQPSDLSSVARRVKVDRGKAETLFRQDGVAPAPPSGTAGRTPAAAEAGRPAPTASAEESSWRSRAASLRRALEEAREEKARTERNLPPGATSSEGTAQRNTLLYRYQVRIDEAQAALDALADECRQSADCQPGWVR